MSPDRESGVTEAGAALEDRNLSSRWARVINCVLDPVWYRLGLFGSDGRPSLHKLIHLCVCVVAVVKWVAFGYLDLTVPPLGMSVQYLWFTLMILTYTLGASAWGRFLDSKMATAMGGGLEKLGAAQEQARAEIFARRASGAAEHPGTEPTPQ